jgi:hypothetical protein
MTGSREAGILFALHVFYLSRKAGLRAYGDKHDHEKRAAADLAFPHR